MDTIIDIPQWRRRRAMNKRQGKFIYATAANGLTVRIPAEQYGSWKAEQDKIRAGTSKADPRMVEQLRSFMEKK